MTYYDYFEWSLRALNKGQVRKRLLVSYGMVYDIIPPYEGMSASLHMFESLLDSVKVQYKHERDMKRFVIWTYTPQKKKG